jgi:hypothetical protein
LLVQHFQFQTLHSDQLRTTRYRRQTVIAEVQVEPPADQAQSDKESLYGIMKSAFQEMTTQVVVAIQTAFRGTKGHTYI